MAGGKQKFTLVQEIGRGTYGAVYRSIFNEKDVAIKKIQLDSLHFEGDRNREPRVMLQMCHPNVLKLIHWEDEGEFRFLVLELCTGSLEGFLRGKYEGSAPNDILWLYQMAAGVNYLHSKNLVHRDLKPDNVLIKGDDSFESETILKISDFGYSKRTTDQGSYSLNSGIKGTLYYLAPELIVLIDSQEVDLKKKASTASDIFALGCTFFRFLTRGTHPFGSGPFVTANIANGKTDLSQLITMDLPSDITLILQRMISKAKEDRPNALNVTTLLKNILSREGKIVGRIWCQSQTCGTNNESVVAIECRFHPVKPKLACSSGRGKVVIFSGVNHVISFSQWKKTILQADTTSDIWSIDWNADGSKLAAGCEDGTLIVWNEDGQKSFEIKKHSEHIGNIKWNGNKDAVHYFFTKSDDQSVIIWDSLNKKPVQQLSFHFDWIAHATWISSNVFASCSFGIIHICEIRKLSPVKTLTHKGRVRFVRWDEASKKLASCSTDGSIQIWSLDRDQPVLTLNSSTGSGIRCFDWYRPSTDKAFPANLLVAGGCEDSALFIWQFDENGKVCTVRRLEGHSRLVQSVAFSGNGQYLASMEVRGKLIIWNTWDWNVVFLTFINAEIMSGSLLIWDSRNNKLVVEVMSADVHVIEFGD